MAASMASVIALAANAVNPDKNKIIAEDNSSCCCFKSFTFFISYNDFVVKFDYAKLKS